MGNRVKILLMIVFILSCETFATAQHFKGLSNTNPAQRRARSARSDQSISGRVVDTGGQPIRGATVNSSKVTGKSPLSSMTAMLGALKPTVTDENGKFTIPDLTGGVYSIDVAARGYCRTEPSPSASKNYYRPGETISITLARGGVITGQVTGTVGEPLIEIAVKAIRVRDHNGKRTQQLSDPLMGMKQWKTDDRGIYRMYGLSPGTYVVVAGGGGPLMGGPYAGDTYTYFPSATRDTATEVQVQAGAELSGIDIRFQENSGRRVSGRVTGNLGGGNALFRGIVVALSHARTGVMEGMSPGSPDGTFQINGISDGDYEIAAMGIGSDDQLASKPQRISVKGSDVTGIDLLLAPLGSISGRVQIDRLDQALISSKPDCAGQQTGRIDGIAIMLKPESGSAEGFSVPNVSGMLVQTKSHTSTSENGEFQSGPLQTGRFRLGFDLPTMYWYVRSVNQVTKESGEQSRPTDLVRRGIAVDGKPVDGVTVTLAEGAASLDGRVQASDSAVSIPRSLVVHLVPAEQEAVDDVVRYYQTYVTSDSSFSFRHLAPGKYFLTLQDPGKEADDSLPVAWRETERTKLRERARIENRSLELDSCQMLKDQIIRFTNASPAR